MHSLRIGLLVVCVALSGCGGTNTASDQRTPAGVLPPPPTASAPEDALLPVSVAKNGFTAEQVAAIHAKWNKDSLFQDRDVSLYSYLHFSEFHPTARVARSGPTVPLEVSLDPNIEAIRFQTAAGEMNLGEYLVHPDSPAQGMIVVHHGKIAFESYPGMREDVAHLAMSVRKTTISLVIALLENEGKVDVNNTVGSYVPELKDTAWSDIKVIDVLDMASGLDVQESSKSLDTPKSEFARFVRAIFDAPDEKGKVEKAFDVIRSAKRLREPGEAFEYSSLNSHVLVLLAEAVEKRPWCEIFHDRVWSKMNVEGDLAVTVSPAGVALPVGFIAIRLRDLTRYGMLYTPSWNQAAREQIVLDEVVKKIQTGGRPALFPPGHAAQMAKVFGGEAPIANSRQWDAVFADGDFFKSGLNGQGLYISPGKDFVIAWFSTTEWTDLRGYARAIARMYARGE